MTHQQGRASQHRGAKQDDSIMSTNKSSIVSKRSVERLYYADEPHFFRYFVKKPQRRAPLINRGYWLRMRAIEHIVRQFLEERSDKPKIVVNLGCGYDPNPWQCLSRYPKACKDVTFIDVDYLPLMEKKRDVVRNTTELNTMLTNLSVPASGRVLLRSDQYLQVGCDLRELSELSTVLASAVDLELSLILCIAEVSITYMNVEAADALIEWACGLPDARFCLLEQILPDGPDHPFAKTMLAHFEKLQTPLRAAGKYPTTVDQEIRFRAAGWGSVSAHNLWELWSSTYFLTSAQRMALDNVESFDEWEEFAMFASHYFLLIASNGVQSSTLLPNPSGSRIADDLKPQSMISWTSWAEYPKPHTYRRYGGSLPVRGVNRKQDLVGNFGGIGLKGRLSSYEVYTPSSVPDQPFHKSTASQAPSARMCHTITDIGDTGALLVGGRTSPDSGLADCWLYDKWANTWERVDDLPIARYRHSAVAIRGDSVLVAGGKKNSRITLNDFAIWHRRRGWIKCGILGRAGTTTEPWSQSEEALDNEQYTIFGGMLMTIDTEYPCDDTITGIFAGGMSKDGVISQEVWLWSLNGYDSYNPTIFLERLGNNPCIARFGASVVNNSGQLLIVGGVTRDRMLTTDEEIVMLDVKSRTIRESLSVSNIRCRGSFPRPLLIGSSIFCSGDNLVIMGGGAVCFSFGTFWNHGCLTLRLHMVPINLHLQTPPNHHPPKLELETWKYVQTFETASVSSTNYVSGASVCDGRRNLDLVIIQRTRVSSAADFSAIVALAKPVIIEELDLGSCTKTWTSTYLKNQIGRDSKVVVHQASSKHMDFVSKNFRYVTKPFGEFMDAVDAGDRLYLRSLSAEKPSELPADLDRDLSAIAKDFQLPAELRMVIENAHSSTLRISGPVNMWLHYDVMANVLCQIRGHRRLLLFPPSDIHHFHFSPGASSSGMDVFSMLHDVELAPTYPHEAVLHPGDVLFLPALWLHTASPTEGVSVAVNVFFRNLGSGYATGKDVYANRDLQAYEKGRQDIARIAKSFGNLPADIRKFYMQRLADELREMAE